MAYDENYPSDGEFIANGPEAIRQKGADLKAIIDEHTGATAGAHADTSISATANGVLPEGTVRGQLSALDVSQATEKTALADADIIGLNDSTAGNAKKKITWANIKAGVIGAALTGLSTTTNSAVTATDSIIVGIGKLQAQLNNAAAVIRDTALTGLSTATNSVVSATDSILVAIGKLQAQITARLPLAGGSMTGALNEAIATVASAATCDIGAAAGNYVTITGTTTITALGTVQAGTRRHVRFAGALALTHNATSLILPGSANITTAAGDTATFISLGSGNWVCAQYQRANGQPVAGGTQSHGLVSWTTPGTYSWTVPANVTVIEIEAGAAGGGGSRGGLNGSNNEAGAGGGCGQYQPFTAFSVTPGASLSIVVGAPGEGSTSQDAAGSTGGNTSVGSLVSLSGGVGGAAASDSGVPAGGAAGGGLNAESGKPPKSITASSTTTWYPGCGGSLKSAGEHLGSGGGINYDTSVVAKDEAPTFTLLGPVIGIYNPSTNGEDAVGVCAGGGGGPKTSSAESKGGKGAPGFVRIRY